MRGVIAETNLPPGLARDRLLEAFAVAGAGPLIVALSGGGDSTALLHLLIEAAPPEARLCAAIVNHGVREGAAREAHEVAIRAQEAGVEARVLTLTWEAGERPTQARLRRKRYAALCALAREIGAAAIAVGHTLSDQRETHAMREKRRAPRTAIAALAPAPLWPEGRGIVLTRPLLRVTREEVRLWLRARGLRWIEDPSNFNMAYERVRVRRDLEEAPARRRNLYAANLEDDAARDAFDAITAEAGAMVRDGLRVEGPIAILHGVWMTYGPSYWRAMTAILTAVSGETEPPFHGAARAIGVRWAGHQDGEPFKPFTVAGCLIEPAPDGAIKISRDPGAVLGRAGVPPLAPLALAPGEEAVWDGRLEVRARAALTLVPARRDANRPAVLDAGGAALTLAEAEAKGLLSARWLLRDHISHVLFTSL